MIFSEIEIVLLAGLALFFILQLVYYYGYLGRPFRHFRAVKKGKVGVSSETPPVSVIICARNESENLEKFLPVVLEQDYPEYEVIVVNEGSSDTSEEVLGALETKYKHLYHTYIPCEAKNLSKKKLAVSLGIKAAKHDVLLFTEADCMPSSRNWIRSIARHFDASTEIVLGYGALPKGKGLIGRLTVFDNLINGLQYLSSALAGKPYMGIGRNLAYRKELFYKGNGFHTFLKLHAGEDNLFVNENAVKDNTKVEISPSGITTMDYCDFRFWKEMKVKKIATSRYYKAAPFAFRNWEGLFCLLFWLFAVATVVAALFNPDAVSSWVLLGSGFMAVVIRWVLQGFVLSKAAKVLQKDDAFYWSVPLLDIMRPLFNLYFRAYRLLEGKSDYTWKV